MRRKIQGNQWRIQDFPQGGGANSQKCYYFSIFCRKLHENERIWTPRGGARPWRPPLDPPMVMSMVILQSSVGFRTSRRERLPYIFSRFFPKIPMTSRKNLVQEAALQRFSFVINSINLPIGRKNINEYICYPQESPSVHLATW